MLPLRHPKPSLWQQENQIERSQVRRQQTCAQKEGTEDGERSAMGAIEAEESLLPDTNGTEEDLQLGRQTSEHIDAFGRVLLR